MEKQAKIIIVLLTTLLVVAYNNCSNGFEMNTFDKLANNETASIDGTDTETDVDIDPVGTIDPVVIIDPIVIVDPIPTKPISPSYKDVFIENADWKFEDDFEGSKDSSFWKGGTKTSHSVSCRSSKNSPSKVLQFDYVYWEDSNKYAYNREWSEQRFELPFEATEIEIRFKLFVPANYKPSPQNHKNLVLWSGEYAKVKANISVSSESWPVSGGTSPSVYVGEDGNNYGHHMLTTDEHYYRSNAGRWQEMVYYLKLAEQEGDHGVFRIYKDGYFLTGTDHPDVRRPGSYAPETDKTIKYSSRGNFMDKGYLMGWAKGSLPEDMYFCVDDFSIRANK